jgi:putative ribosome biogenesis GTPase RsgA
VLIGQTQTGKSTFINDMAGEYLADVGSEEDSMSETSKVETYWLEELGLRLIDTPGFSDSRGLKDDI